jgi:hypothetical protein
METFVMWRAAKAVNVYDEYFCMRRTIFLYQHSVVLNFYVN